MMYLIYTLWMRFLVLLVVTSLLLPRLSIATWSCGPNCSSCRTQTCKSETSNSCPNCAARESCCCCERSKRFIAKRDNTSNSENPASVSDTWNKCRSKCSCTKIKALDAESALRSLRIVFKMDPATSLVCVAAAPALLLPANASVFENVNILDGDAHAPCLYLLFCTFLE